MPNPVSLTIDHPEKQSRGVLLLRTFLGFLYVGIPHGIMLFFYEIGVGFVTFIAWFAILFTGKYPERMHKFVVGYLRWTLRVSSYLLMLHDEYPPFNGDE